MILIRSLPTRLRLSAADCRSIRPLNVRWNTSRPCGLRPLLAYDRAGREAVQGTTASWCSRACNAATRHPWRYEDAPSSLRGGSQRVQQADIDPASHLRSTDRIGRCGRTPVPPPRVSCDPRGLRGYVAWTERDPQSGRSSLCQMGLLYDIAARALYTWAAKPEGEPVTTPEPARSRSLVERSPIHGCLRVFPKRRSAGTIMVRMAAPRTIATWR